MMRTEEIFILPNRKSTASILYHTDAPVQGIRARLIIWVSDQYTSGRRFVCQQIGEAVFLGVNGFDYLIQDQPDGAIRVDKLDAEGVVQESILHSKDQDWYHELEPGLDKPNFPGYEAFIKEFVND